MITFITQPTYLPWIGIFKAIDYCDNFVFYDDVQFEKDSWQSRNKILNKSEKKTMYLIVPTKKNTLKTNINEIEIANPKFYIDHIKKIRTNYKKNDYKENVIMLLEKIYGQNHKLLYNLNASLIIELANYIGLKTNFLYSHDLLHIEGDKNERLVQINKLLQSTTYLAQCGTKKYIETEQFRDKNIEIVFLNFNHPIYEQGLGAFIPYLSIIDMLISIGPEKTREIIKNIELKPL